jgi:PAS domain S-box-containing protein
MGEDESGKMESSLLYVEDEEDVRELVSSMLTKKYPELQLLVAGDGRSGLDMYRERQPEIVITDIRMPVMDGLQMASAIRALNPDTFIIAVTAHSDTDHLVNAIEIGFNHYVLKPVDYRKLFASIDKCRVLHAMKQRVAAQEAHIRRLSRVVAESPSSVIITDSHELITYVNPRFTRLTGYTMEEVIGLHPRFLKSDDMSPDRYVELRNSINAGKDWRGELRNRHKSGKLYWEEVSIFPLRNEDGDIVNFVAVSEDISQRKEAEEAIHALNDELTVRATALETANSELEAFNYTVAHDLHTPLQWIGGYSRAILKHNVHLLDACYSKYLEEICQGVLRMEQTIAALLNFSRFSRGALQLQTVDLGEIAEAVAADLVKSEPDRQVTFRIPTGVTVDCDRNLLYVVLQNLLGNAWKYTDKQQITVIEFNVAVQGENTTFFVRDNGPGFDPAEAGKIFAPFQRLTGFTDSKGLGIGLATVQRIINRHGGRVWAEAVPGGGATFYFTLKADTEGNGVGHAYTHCG